MVKHLRNVLIVIAFALGLTVGASIAPVPAPPGATHAP